VGRLARGLGAIALSAVLATQGGQAAAATPPFLWLPLDDGAPISFYVNDDWTVRNGLPTYELPLPSGTLYKHLGTDFPLPAGSPVYAAARGTVTFSQDGFGDGCAKNTADNFGNAVWIKHDNGFTTMYAHMQKGSVVPRVGQWVEAGVLIGRVANSGNTFGGQCGGNHLHFEVRNASFVVVNPYNRDTGYLWASDPPRHAVGVVPPPALPCDTTGAPSSTVHLPNVTKTLGGPEGWVTPFYIQNVGPATASIETSFYRFSDGALVTCRRTIGLLAGRTFEDNPNIDGDLPDDTQFSVVVRSWGAPVVAVVDQLRGSGASTLAAAYAGFTSGATAVYLPNVTRRFFGYDVPFIVQSLGPLPARVSARFVSFDGTKTFATSVVVASGRSVVIDPDATPGLVDGTQYAVSLTSDQPIGVVANAYNVTGASVAYTHNGLASGASSLFAPYAVKSATGQASPVVVQNLGQGPLDATLSFTPLGGGVPQTFTLAAIGAGSSKAFDPRFATGTTTPCALPSPACLGSGEYSLRITAPGTIAAVVLPTGPLTAAAYAATPAPQRQALLPLVRRNVGGPGGWTTSVVIQSSGATSATLSWYRLGDGALAATQVVTLPLDGAARVDPRSVVGLADDARYSLVVRAANGAIAAIAYDQGPGGDAAMIAEAFPAP